MSECTHIIRGHTVIFDECDRDLVTNHKWYPRYKKSGNVYMSRTIWVGKNKYKSFILHREIMGAQKGQIVDHKNGNTLDNRRSNLRFCTVSQNAQNSFVKPGKSGINGIMINRRGKFEIRIHVNKVNRCFGTYLSLDSAIPALEYYLYKHHGAFSRIHSQGFKYAR